MYPGLFKPIMLTKSRYNQHTAKFASIIEVGATGNTLEQCLTSMKYLAKVLEQEKKKKIVNMYPEVYLKKKKGII